MKKEVPVFSPAQLADSIMLVYRAALLGGISNQTKLKPVAAGRVTQETCQLCHHQGSHLLELVLATLLLTLPVSRQGL
jgi:hypothetical protein